jgi:predicted component of type VI protein secretion system
MTNPQTVFQQLLEEELNVLKKDFKSFLREFKPDKPLKINYTIETLYRALALETLLKDLEKNWKITVEATEFETFLTLSYQEKGRKLPGVCLTLEPCVPVKLPEFKHLKEFYEHSRNKIA